MASHEALLSRRVCIKNSLTCILKHHFSEFGAQFWSARNAFGTTHSDSARNSHPYFLFANFVTKFISEGQNELIMVPIIMIIIELIIRIRPSPISSFFNLWSIVDKVRIGATYAIILEAFKLGS